MKLDDEQITSLFIGGIGIKTAVVGEEIVHTRPGGYIYLYLETSEEKKEN